MKMISAVASGMAFLFLCAGAAFTADDVAATDDFADTREIPVAPPVTITFAPPEVDGRFVLGIFNSDGFLIRTLLADEDESAFDVGLNGFVTTWDGNTDDGAAAPPGRYFVRGYVVGDMDVEGVDYHFNDWAADGFGAWRALGDVLLVGPDRTLVLAETSDGWEWIALNASNEILWRQPAPDRRVATSADWIVVGGEGALQILNPASGEEVGRIPVTQDDLLFSMTGNRLIVWADDALKKYDLPATEPVGEPRELSAVQSLAATRAGAVAVGSSGDAVEILWLFEDGERAFRWDSGLEVFATAPGADGESIWIAVEGEGHRMVREFDAEGESLRELLIEPENPMPTRISTASGMLGLFSSWDSGTRWIVLKREADSGTEAAADSRTVDWRIISDRTTTDSDAFGLRRGVLVADGERATLPTSLEVRLEPNPLAPRRRQTLKLDIRVEGGRAWITAEDGLRLVPVSEGGAWARVGMEAGAPGEASVFLGDGWVVEEFLVRGLGAIYAFDAGSILLKRSGE